MAVLSFQHHTRIVDSHDQDSIKAPVFTNKMLENEQNRVWELLDIYLCTKRDNSGTPLVVWTQATNKLVPKVTADDAIPWTRQQDSGGVL